MEFAQFGRILRFSFVNESEFGNATLFSTLTITVKTISMCCSSLPLKLETSMYPLLGETGSGHSISKWSLYEYYRLIILNQ